MTYSLKTTQCAPSTPSVDFSVDAATLFDWLSLLGYDRVAACVAYGQVISMPSVSSTDLSRLVRRIIEPIKLVEAGDSRSLPDRER